MWQVLEAEANTIVAGSAILGVRDYATAISALRNSEGTAGLRHSKPPEMIVTFKPQEMVVSL
ncbi:MAG: hypothetical protein KME43_13605 [Myxacorys chilensis ATA2-1-KO14]|nr:hypothetical protein [Myxacorys chilensis ATA2-1-KO14]